VNYSPLFDAFLIAAILLAYNQPQAQRWIAGVRGAALG
jgi:hypothetical protein